jgi:hypothetical protein
MKSLYLTSLIAGLFFLCASVSAQTTQSNSSASPKWYIELPGLNTSTYAELHQSLQNHARYEIREACVPAHVLVIGLKGNLVAGANEWQNIRTLLVNKGFQQVSEMTNAGPETFMQRCRSARTGQ